jgi:hypothetical protein
MLEHFEVAQVQKTARKYEKIRMSRDDFDDCFEYFNDKNLTLNYGIVH